MRPLVRAHRTPAHAPTTSQLARNLDSVRFGTVGPWRGATGRGCSAPDAGYARCPVCARREARGNANPNRQAKRCSNQSGGSSASELALVVSICKYVHTLEFAFWAALPGSQTRGTIEHAAPATPRDPKRKYVHELGICALRGRCWCGSNRAVGAPVGKRASRRGGGRCSRGSNRAVALLSVSALRGAAGAVLMRLESRGGALVGKRASRRGDLVGKLRGAATLSASFAARRRCRQASRRGDVVGKLRSAAMLSVSFAARRCCR